MNGLHHATNDCETEPGQHQDPEALEGRGAGGAWPELRLVPDLRRGRGATMGARRRFGRGFAMAFTRDSKAHSSFSFLPKLTSPK